MTSDNDLFGELYGTSRLESSGTLWNFITRVMERGNYDLVSGIILGLGLGCAVLGLIIRLVSFYVQV